MNLGWEPIIYRDQPVTNYDVQQAIDEEPSSSHTQMHLGVQASKALERLVGKIQRDQEGAASR